MHDVVDAQGHDVEDEQQHVRELEQKLLHHECESNDRQTFLGNEAEHVYHDMIQLDQDAFLSVSEEQCVLCRAMAIRAYRCLVLCGEDILCVFHVWVFYDSIVLPRRRNLHSSLLQTLVLVVTVSMADASITITQHDVALDYPIPNPLQILAHLTHTPHQTSVIVVCVVVSASIFGQRNLH